MDLPSIALGQRALIIEQLARRAELFLGDPDLFLLVARLAPHAFDLQ